jgi:hypothetical protein
MTKSRASGEGIPAGNTTRVLFVIMRTVVIISLA